MGNIQRHFVIDHFVQLFDTLARGIGVQDAFGVIHVYNHFQNEKAKSTDGQT